MQNRKIFIIIHKRHIFAYTILLLSAALLIFQYFINTPRLSKDAIHPKNSDYSLPSASNAKQPKLAIIIDDFGLNRKGVREMMAINRHMTFAVMPYLKYSKQDAAAAHGKGYEVILHLPMQSQKVDNPVWLGPNPVKTGMKETEIQRIVSDSLASIPYSVGVNIHMGALSSENARVVSSVMHTVKSKGLYFVDSVTSSKTVCKTVARDVGVRFIARDIFLEGPDEKTKPYIKQQLEKAGDMALKYGYAVVTGHVGSAGGVETANAIKEMIPVLESKGIRFVFISELI